VDDVAGLLGACDMGVLSSRSEGLPNALLESMAAGLPVVATDIAGVREALGIDEDREDRDAPGEACLAPVGDSAAMAQRILALMRVPQQRAALGAANQRRIASHFAVDRMGSRVAMLIADQLAGEVRATVQSNGAARV
jgi:glycosyltransferase involved in cell wall biosynthesis